jgi:hypothetical protein
MTRTLARIASAALLTALLTACGSTPDASTAQAPAAPATTSDVSQDATATATDTATDDTAVIVDLTWAQTSDADKDNMCAGIDLLGTGWAAAQMREGAGYDDSVDWEQAALLVQDKCALR